MAYIKNQNQRQGPITTSGQSSIISANTTDPNASDAQGTGWTDLKKYLDNNNGLGAGVGQAVTADSQGKIDSAAGKINEYQTKAAGQNQTGVDQNNSLSAYKSQISADPTKIDATAYRNDTSAAYKGLTDAQQADSYGDAYNAYGGAKSSYDALKSDDWASRSQAVTNTYGKDNAGYTKGMGMLDTFVLQGDQSGKDQINSYVNKNAGTFATDGRDALSTAKSGVQSNLDMEKNRWSTLLGETNKAVGDKRTDILGGQQIKNGRYDEIDRQSIAAEAEIAKKFREEGVAAPKSALNYYKVGDASGYIAPAELDALNALSNLDGGASYSSKKGSADINWDSVLQDIESSRIIAPVNTVNTRTEYPSGGDAGGKGENRTTYPDGSYTIKTDSGVVINYNANGTIKGKIIDPNGVLG